MADHYIARIFYAMVVGAVLIVFIITGACNVQQKQWLAAGFCSLHEKVDASDVWHDRWVKCDSLPERSIK